MPELLMSVNLVTLLQQRQEQKLSLESATLQSDLTHQFRQLLNYDMLKEGEAKNRLRHLSNAIIKNKKTKFADYYRTEYSLLLQNLAFQALFNDNGNMKDEIVDAIGIRELYNQNRELVEVSVVNAFIAAISDLVKKKNIPVISSDTLKKNLSVYLSKRFIQDNEDPYRILIIAEDICKKLRELSLTDPIAYSLRDKLLVHLEAIPSQNNTLELDANEMRVLATNKDLSMYFNGCIDHRLLFPTTSLELSKDYRLKSIRESYLFFNVTKEKLLTRQKADNSDAMVGVESTDPTPTTFTFESPTLTQQQALVFKLPEQSKEWENMLKDATSLNTNWPTNQTTYAHRCYDAVQDAVQELELKEAENKPMSAMELYTFLADKRQQIAKAAAVSDKDASVFGQLRTEEPGSTNAFLTFIFSNGGAYTDFYDQLKKMHDDNEGVTKPGVLTGAGIIEPASTTHIEIESGKPMSPLILSGFSTDKAYIQTILDSYGEGQLSDTNNIILIIHSDPSQTPKLFEKIEPIFSKLMQRKGEASEEVIKDIGRIAWYLSQATPCKRGSAAITEMYVATLFKKLGIPLQPYRRNQSEESKESKEKKKYPSLDLEAIFEPNIEEFSNKFATWYKITPKVVFHAKPSSSA